MKSGDARLSLDDMLGSYPVSAGYEQLEFQVGRTLVWIIRPMSQSREASVARANDILPACWSDAPAALRKVADVLAPSVSEQPASGRLSLMSIRVRPEDGSADYDFQADVDEDLFDDMSGDLGLEIITPLPPHLPSETLVVVRRSAAGDLSIS